MKFDHEKVKEALRIFWRENKQKLHYFQNGKEVHPKKVSACFFQLDEVDAIDGYNFSVTALNLSVQIDSEESLYKADFLIKVVAETTSDENFPKEKIVGVQNDRITLRK